MDVVVPFPWIVLSPSLPELPMDDEKWLVINVSRLIFHDTFFTITVKSDFILTFDLRLGSKRSGVLPSACNLAHLYSISS